MSGSGRHCTSGTTPGTAPGAAPGPGGALQRVLHFVRAQRPPFRPTRAVIVRGRTRLPQLSVQFGAPSLAGLLQARPLTSRGPA